MSRSGRRLLVLLRHAKSSWENEAWIDFERPLDERGRADAPRVGRELQRRGFKPQAILCSPAKRTRQTLRAIRPWIGSAPATFPRVLYLADEQEWIEVLRNLPSRCRRVLAIGHNPGLQGLLHLLTGWTPAKFPTGAAAILRVPRGWPALAHGTRLLDWFRPKDLR